LVREWEYREQRAKRRRLPAGSPDELVRLARRLTYAGLAVTRQLLHQAAFEHAAGRLGIDPAVALENLLLSAAEIRTDPKNNVLETAKQVAANDWQSFLGPTVKPNRRKVVALVHWLSRLGGNLEWVAVPRDEIAEWLGVYPTTAGKILRELHAAGFVALKDGGAYSFKAGEAREAKCLVPRVPAA
jgi:hypothetical protein